MEKKELIKALEVIRNCWEKQKQLELLGVHIEDFFEPLEGLMGELVVKYCEPVGEGDQEEYDALTEWIFHGDSISAEKFLNQLTKIKSRHANRKI